MRITVEGSGVSSERRIWNHSIRKGEGMDLKYPVTAQRIMDDLTHMIMCSEHKDTGIETSLALRPLAGNCI